MNHELIPEEMTLNTSYMLAVLLTEIRPIAFKDNYCGWLNFILNKITLSDNLDTARPRSN